MALLILVNRVLCRGEEGHCRLVFGRRRASPEVQIFAGVGVELSRSAVVSVGQIDVSSFRSEKRSTVRL